MLSTVIRFANIGVMVLACLMSRMTDAQGQGYRIPGVPERAGVFDIRLATEHQTYRVREPILLHVFIVNATAESFTIKQGPPWCQTDLVVTNQQGNVFPPVDGKFPVRGSLVGVRIEPRTTTSLTGTGRDGNPGWTNLSNWGYRALPPGEYTIAAIPTIFAMEGHDGTITARMTTPYVITSNVLHITVTP